MLRTINSFKTDSLVGSSDKKQKRIENHKKAIKRAIIAQRNKWMSNEYQSELVNPFCD